MWAPGDEFEIQRSRGQILKLDINAGIEVYRSNMSGKKHLRDKET